MKDLEATISRFSCIWILSIGAPLKSSPQCFYQLYTLHTKKLGHYIPLVFFLLPNKKEQTYLTMLELLLDECRKREIDFSPKAINLDFEISTHNAFRHVFSQTLRSGDATFTWNKPGCERQLSWAWKKTMKTRTVMFISGCAFYLDCLSLDQTKCQGFLWWHSLGFTIGLQNRAFWAVLVKTLHWRKRLSPIALGLRWDWQTTYHQLLWKFP